MEMIRRCVYMGYMFALGICTTLGDEISDERSSLDKQDNATEAQFVSWYTDYDKQTQAAMFAEVSATWAYETNITDENEAAMVQASGVAANFTKMKSTEMTSRFAGVTFTNQTNQRLYNKISKIGDAALTAEKFEKLAKLKSRMEGVYSTAKVCRNQTVTNITLCPRDQVMSLDPEITQLLDTVQDYDELLYVWKTWRDASGRHMRNDYIRYVDLKNEAARANGYKDNAEAWRAPYVEPSYGFTDSDFLSDIQDIWETMRPLYEQLHAYVRRKLVEKYGSEKVNPSGPIPAHLLGNMWAQTWLSVLPFTVPFHSKPPLDVTVKMIEQNWTAGGMFRKADRFFQDLGMLPMPEVFWNRSMMAKPDDRQVACHASAWDFYNGEDFRIKQCATVNMQNLFTIHHEMGHIQYFLQYKDQPVTFRDGANDGFHEAIGDTLALSVSTPVHLEKLGLLAGYNATDTDLDLNFMFSTALDKVAFLPFALTMDMYRYDVFNGIIGTDQLNAKWWEYVVKYQGICAPVTRNEKDFDPGAKYHIPADVPYMRYFVSFILQFQFHEAMCKAAGHSGPLYTCDIDGSKEAGRLLGQALELGSSMPWQYAMRKLTGQDRMDARPLMAFFEPLHRFLENENAKTSALVGWTKDSSTCVQQSSPLLSPSPLVPIAASATLQISSWKMTSAFMMATFWYFSK